MVFDAIACVPTFLPPSHFGTMGSLPLGPLRTGTSVTPTLIALVLRVSSTWTVPNAVKEFVHLIVDAVHMRGPDLYTPVECAGGLLEPLFL
jgi:hypothetical protein